MNIKPVLIKWQSDKAVHQVYKIVIDTIEEAIDVVGTDKEKLRELELELHAFLAKVEWLRFKQSHE